MTVVREYLIWQSLSSRLRREELGNFPTFTCIRSSHIVNFISASVRVTPDLVNSTLTFDSISQSVFTSAHLHCFLCPTFSTYRALISYYTVTVTYGYCLSFNMRIKLSITAVLAAAGSLVNSAPRYVLICQ
jgi:hypothetical protein